MCFGVRQRNKDYLLFCAYIEELEGVSEQTFCGHVDPPALLLRHF